MSAFGESSCSVAGPVRTPIFRAVWAALPALISCRLSPTMATSVGGSSVALQKAWIIPAAGLLPKPESQPQMKSKWCLIFVSVSCDTAADSRSLVATPSFMPAALSLVSSSSRPLIGVSGRLSRCLTQTSFTSLRLSAGN